MGALGAQPQNPLRNLEGHTVDLVLVDGSRLEDVKVILAGRGAVSSLWLEVDGMDVFIHQTQVTDARESTSPRAA
jgi:hypothetical protein